MSDRWRPQARVGPYLLIEQLGVGGMGEVWAADDTRLNRRVALKRLLGEIAHKPEALARFKREARTQAALSSHHIASLYGLERSEGEGGSDDVFIVMEYIEGQSLRSVLGGGALAIDEAIGMFGQLAVALSVAHRAGVVHRDLKPSNLILRPDGTLVVVDFGLAWQVDKPGGDDDDITTSGAIVGSVAYMSPQQAGGARVGPEGDVWSAGVTLYEMMTGQHPFDGESSVERLAAILRDEPTPLRELRPDVPKALADLVTRCLKKEPLERPQSGDELLDLLPAIPLPVAGRAAGFLEPGLIARATAHPPLSRAARFAAIAAAVLGILVTLWCVRLTWHAERSWLRPADGERVASALLTELGLLEGRPHRATGYAASEDAQSFLWVRFSPEPLHVSRKLPWWRYPPHQGGEVLVLLTPDGRLRHFERWSDDSQPPAVDLDALLRVAGLGGPLAYEQGATDEWVRGAAVQRAVAQDGTPLAIAKRGGDIVQFRRADLPLPRSSFRGNIGESTGTVGLLLLIVVVVCLAWVQRRRKRGDARGAVTFGLVAASLELLTTAAAPQMLWYGGWREHLAYVALIGFVSMTAYYGFEPIVRRRWPGMLVGWERMVHWRSGEFVLGRELLLGCAAILPFALAAAVHMALGVEEVPVRELVARSLSGPSHYVSVVFMAMSGSLMMVATMLVVGALSIRVVRLQWLAILLASAAPAWAIAQSALRPAWPLALVTAAVLTVLLFRGGVVAVTTFGAANLVLWLTFSPAVAAWTVPYSVVSVCFVMALVVTGGVLAKRIPRVSTRSRAAALSSPLAEAAAGPTQITAATRAAANHGAAAEAVTQTVQPDAMPKTVREGAGSAPGRDESNDPMPTTVRQGGSEKQG